MKKTRILQFDFMKTLAVIGVILGHSLALAADVTGTMSLMAEYLTVVMRPVVPIFLFLAGMFYKPEQKMKEVGTRVCRIFVPYLFFAGVFTILYLAGGFQYSFGNYLLRIFTCEIHPIYYYVFVMMEFMVIMFFLEKMFCYSRLEIPLFVISLAVSLIHGCFAKEILAHMNVENHRVLFYTYRTPLLWFSFYAFGIVFQKNPGLWTMIKKSKYWFRGLWIGLILFYWIMTWMHIGDRDNLNSVITTLVCFSAILALLTVPVKSKKWIFLSQRSYTVYLAHVPFYYLMTLVWQKYPCQNSVLVILTNLFVLTAGVILTDIVGKLILKKKSFYVIGS